MESLLPETLIFLIAAGFLAAFVDSVVGGGGLIAMPALLLAGLPPAAALGTNKLAGTAASLTSSIQFLRSGHIETRLAFALFPLSFAGSILGSYTVSRLPSEFLKPLVVVLLLVVAIYTAFKKNWGKDAVYRGLTNGKRALAAAAALAIGYYDGFFGPGTGSFLLFVFLLLGFDFVRAAGNARLLNFASNIAALAAFAVLGLVNYVYGVPMALGMIAGAAVGSRFAIKRGAAFVKPLFLTVTALLIGKQLWDLWFA